MHYCWSHKFPYPDRFQAHNTLKILLTGVVPWQQPPKLLNTRRENVWLWGRHSRLEPESGCEKDSIHQCLSASWLLLLVSSQLWLYLPTEASKILQARRLKHWIRHPLLPSSHLSLPPSLSPVLLLLSLSLSSFLYFIGFSRIYYFLKKSVWKNNLSPT